MKHWVTAAVLGTLAMAAVACGSDSGGSSTAAAGGGKPTSVTLGMTELFPTGYFGLS